MVVVAAVALLVRRPAFVNQETPAPASVAGPGAGPA
jgi:hypothetical protein